MTALDVRQVSITAAHTAKVDLRAQASIDAAADVTALDVRPVSVTAAHAAMVDLRDQSSIDAAADWLAAPIDAVFAGAGLATVLVGFVGSRHLLERLAPLMPDEHVAARVPLRRAPDRAGGPFPARAGRLVKPRRP